MRVTAHLADHCGLPLDDVQRLLGLIEADLADKADAYCDDLSRRVRGSSACFWYTYVFLDSQGMVRDFHFAVSMAAREYGVVCVELAEERAWNPLPPLPL